MGAIDYTIHHQVQALQALLGVDAVSGKMAAAGGLMPVTDGSGGITWKKPPAVINVMDYGAKGDGSDQTAALTAAVATYNAQGGGVLYSPPGYFCSSGGHVLTAPGIVLGSGFGTIAPGVNGTTIWGLTNGANQDLLTLGAHAITVWAMGFYGNKGNQDVTSRGLVTSATAAANYFRLFMCWLDSFNGDNIYLQGPGSSLEGMMWGVRSQQSAAHGICYSSGAAADSHATDCVFAQNAFSGLYVNATDVVLTNVHSWGNGTSTTPPTSQDVSGLFMPSGAGGYLRVTGGYFETNGNSTAGGRGLSLRGNGSIVKGVNCTLNRAQGIYAYSNSNTQIVGATIRSNNLNNGSGAAGAGIEFDTCTACSVVGGQMFDTQSSKTQTYGYAENGNTCNACLIDGMVSRAADHKTGSWLVGSGNPTPTAVGTNVG